MNITTKMNHLRRKQNGSVTLIELMVGLIVVALVLLAILPALARLLGAERKEPNEVETAPTPTPEPVASEPIVFPWAEILIVGGSIIGFAVLIGAVFFGVKMYRTNMAAHNANVQGWEKLEARYNNVVSRWSEYEMDIIKIIDFPMLTDMSAPTTIAFHQAFRDARMNAPKDKKYVGDYSTSPFAASVKELESAFDVAENTAKKSKWKHYNWDEKKRLTRAKDMLGIALNTAATAHERQVAYRGAMKLLADLIDVPQVTVMAIEDKTKLALVA